MKNDLGVWLYDHAYSIDTAALLLAGINPYAVNQNIDIAINQKVDGYMEAMKYLELLQSAVQQRSIILVGYDSFEEYLADYELTDIDQEQLDEEREKFDKFQVECMAEHLFNPSRLAKDCPIPKETLIEWAISNGVREFPKGYLIKAPAQSKANTVIDDLLYPDNPYLSHKLKVVINVWLELVENGTNGKTPKQAAEDIIKEKYPGTPDVKELVKVINWYPDGRRIFPPLKDYEE